MYATSFVHFHHTPSVIDDFEKKLTCVFPICRNGSYSARMNAMKRTTTTRRRQTTGSLGIPGLKLPRGVPTLVRSVGRLFGGRSKKSAGAARGMSGGVWIWVVLGLALAAWIAWDTLGRTKGDASRAESTEVVAHAESAVVESHPESAETVARTESAESAKGAARSSKPPAWKDGDWVRGRGVVTKVLPDDTDPPRHQRFIVLDDWGRTFLFAHNIDVAKRVEGLAVGDEIRFRGEYRINAEGGVINWTHAPSGGGRGPGGWIEHAGVTYK